VNSLKPQDGRVNNNKQPLGKVGQIIVSTVALAILLPFIGILWAWASRVMSLLGAF